MRDRNQDKKANNLSFWASYKKAIMTGLVAGPLSSTLTFPIDKVGFYYQTKSAAVSPTFFEALTGAFRRPLSGYFPGIINAASKNVILFPVMTGLDMQFQYINPGSPNNSRVAAFFAGIITVYITAPIAFLKAWRYNNVTLQNFIQAFSSKNFSGAEPLKLRDLARGTHAKALRDGVQAGVYFTTLKLLIEYTNDEISAGAVAGVTGGFVSNPLSVISTNQQIAAVRTNMPTMAKKLYDEGGVPRFYRGFFTTTFLRMGVQGAAIGGGIKLVEKLHAYKSKKHS